MSTKKEVKVRVRVDEVWSGFEAYKQSLFNKAHDELSAIENFITLTGEVVEEKNCTHSQHPSGAMYCGYDCTYPGAPRRPTEKDEIECDCAERLEAEAINNTFITRDTRDVMNLCAAWLRKHI